ncbi:MAG: hypothetical protein ACTSO7_17375 [Candidatus Heimdallarchaeota archaeon]
MKEEGVVHKRKSNRNQKGKNNPKDKKQKLTMQINSLDKYIDFWEDGTVAIRTNIGEARSIQSTFLAEIFDFSKEHTTQKYVKGTFQIMDSNLETENVNVSLRKISKMNRGKKSEIISISCPQIHRSYRKKVIITIPFDQLELTPTYHAIKKLAAIGYDIQKLAPILRPSRKLPSEMKKQAISSFVDFLQKKQLYPILEFTNFYNKTIQLFDDNILAATFDGTKEGTTNINIPDELFNLIIHNQKYITIIRKDQLYISKLGKGNQSNSAIEQTQGTKINLLWCGLDKTSDFKLMISSIKKGWDYRPHLLMAFLKQRKNSLIWEKQFYDKIIDLLQIILIKGYSLPIVRTAFRNPKHCNPVFEKWLETIMNRTFHDDNSTSQVLILQEVLITDKSGNFNHSADWFIAFLNENGELDKYIIELKTTPGVEQTRTLQRAIANYSNLVRLIPEIGYPLIIVGWQLNMEKWLNYSFNFKVLLLDSDDIFNLAANNNISLKLQSLSNLMQQINSEKIKSQSLKNAQTILDQWIATEKATREEITRYCTLLKIPIQNLLFLLRYLYITDIDAQSSIYRKGFVQLNSLTPLNSMHKHLQQGTSLIVEEELDYCTQRITKIQNKQIKPRKNEKLSCNRRRRTFDLSKLHIIQTDLELLNSLKNYWEYRSRIIGVRMLINENNQGALFENEIYQELQQEGLSVIRHVAVMISNRAREIDLFAFHHQSINSTKMIIISCKDVSRYQKKFHDAKRDILGRLFNLEKILDITQADEARFYIKVQNSYQEKKVHDWTQTHFIKQQKNNLCIIIKKQNK